MSPGATSARIGYRSGRLPRPLRDRRGASHEPEPVSFQPEAHDRRRRPRRRPQRERLRRRRHGLRPTGNPRGKGTRDPRNGGGGADEEEHVFGASTRIGAPAGGPQPFPPAPTPAPVNPAPIGPIQATLLGPDLSLTLESSVGD